MRNPPVIILAFSNDREGQFLRSIAEEQRRIRKALKPLKEKKLLHIEELSNARAEDIFEAFRCFKDRVQIFHYGGHANDLELLLSSGHFQVDQFSDYLKEQKGLELVFMNGCATQAQQDSLTKANVASVILTNSAISDKAAQEFSEQFYQNLASGRTVDRSFNEASAAVKSSDSSQPNRKLYWRKNDNEPSPDSLPWELFQSSPSEWSLKTQKRSPWVYAGLFSALVLISTIMWQIFSPKPGAFDVIVKIQGDKSDSAIDAGEVILELTDQILRRKLDQDRMVRFQVAPDYEGQVGVFSFSHRQPYQAIWKDTSIELKEKMVLNMPIHLTKLDKIRGVLKDFDSEQPLKNVLVRVKDIMVYTGEDGGFTLLIPDSLQKKKQDIYFSKPGYKTDYLSGFSVHTQEIIRLYLSED